LVVAVVGDGGFQMSFNELATVRQYNIPVKILVINNGYLGMVRQWQEQFYEHRYSHSDMEVAPDFVKLAGAYGVPAFRATKVGEVIPTLEQALRTPGPVLIEMQVAREENVFPIVPAGAALKDMILA
ncbi:MAG: thiamine pyrophosphate-dependent enzyme, partial [Blastocatellia bacterium]